MSVTFAVLVAAVVLGNAWWKSEAANYSDYIYKPLLMQPTLRAGNVLDLQLRDPGWLSDRKLDDFIPDHDHLMHLYMIRWPQMDVVYHLHPEPVSTGDFQLPLPSVPAGDYRLYADVVHAGGFPETIVGTVTLPAIAGRPLAGDDAEGADSPVTNGSGVVRCEPRAAIQTPRRLHDGVEEARTTRTQAAGGFSISIARPARECARRHGALHGHAGPRRIRKDGRRRVCAYSSHRHSVRWRHS